jgi:hypothetical protein
LSLRPKHRGVFGAERPHLAPFVATEMNHGGG